MSASNKLSTAVKALYFLAESYPNPKSSKEIAESIAYNPSKLRKILSYLCKSKIVESTRGKAGGFLLAKPIDRINLQEIYCSVEFRKAFYLDVNRSKKKSDYTHKFNNYFLNLFSEVQVEIEKKMSGIILADVIEEVKTH
ncbi:MAG: Rrf2 family transcriptional regulator [Ignavibacteriae bacterium]|nr:Rrf2 family transcriptional regulator [Ignavibacteriota bacterium]MCB0750234.1 Rrf2 family transcriptional regulator [Ignavibacteriota bacterium]MCB9219292.1 Rrf2 family transcriptional regulator [Ignavibacteriales bacterium]MCB9260178.1 Rrf2 family transcriptional regulator [Ignavibacteriales bacterium]